MKRVPFRNKSTDSNKPVNRRTSKHQTSVASRQSSASQAVVHNVLSLYSKSEHRDDTEGDISLTMKENQNYIEQMDMELRNFDDQANEPSFHMGETLDESRDVKQEFCDLQNLHCRTEQSHPVARGNSFKALELCDIDIQTFPSSSAGMNGSKATEDQTTLQQFS